MEESAFIAYHLHWPQADIMGLEHPDRRCWAEEVSRINERMSADA